MVDSVVSVWSFAGLLIVYVIGIIGFVGGSGVRNWLLLVRRLACRACVVVLASDSGSESESESLWAGSGTQAWVSKRWIVEAGLSWFV